jgi:hypothetical protein
LEERVADLERRLAEQERLILQQRLQLEAQGRELQWLADGELMDLRGGAAVAGPPFATGRDVGRAQTGQASSGGETQAPVGAPPPEPERPPEVAALAEVGGVLTPAGELVVEPTLEYSHVSNNRLTFRGIELQDVVLIGVIEASDADRDLVSAALTARYGITSRLEVEAKVPFLYRTDRVSFLIPRVGEPDIERTESLDGFGLGDIEFAGHYQINRGLAGWPYFIANLRFKTTTGEGPFDIDRDAAGIEQELATGSGFFAVEPSVTILYPSDPLVLFTNLSYQVNIEDDIDEQIGDVIVRTVDPGDAVGATVGFGFAVNEELSFSLGYKHTFIMETETEIFDPGVNQTRVGESETLHVGALLLGLAYLVSDDVSLNLDFDLGITDDAPDMKATLRVPVSFQLF